MVMLRAPPGLLLVLLLLACWAHGGATSASATVTTTPCATDSDCPFSGAWRCCGASEQAENCPPPSHATTGLGHCVLPGAAGATECHCVAGVCQTLPESRDYAPKQAGKKQWLMIGDSIHGGCLNAGTSAIPNGTAEHDIQVVSNPGNGANVWWGAHCLDGWLTDPSRTPADWDVITFNFGLHDLALDNERIEPEVYTRYLANITQRLADAAPQAKLIWVTNTPVPEGIDGYCNKTTGAGGCPPRKATDPPIYNAAALKAIRSVPAASRVEILDLYAIVTAKCGEGYARCPAGCVQTDRDDGNCFQIPLNVHYGEPSPALTPTVAPF